MKKILLSALFLVALSGFTMAQDHHKPVHHRRHHPVHHHHHHPVHHKPVHH